MHTHITIMLNKQAVMSDACDMHVHPCMYKTFIGVTSGCNYYLQSVYSCLWEYSVL